METHACEPPNSDLLTWAIGGSPVSKFQRVERKEGDIDGKRKEGGREEERKEGTIYLDMATYACNQFQPLRGRVKKTRSSRPDLAT